MSLKTGIEIAVHISYLHLKELHKIGWVQYRIAIHYSVKDSPQKVPHQLARSTSCPATSITVFALLINVSTNQKWIKSAAGPKNTKSTTSMTPSLTKPPIISKATQISHS